MWYIMGSFKLLTEVIKFINLMVPSIGIDGWREVITKVIVKRNLKLYKHMVQEEIPKI